MADIIERLLDGPQPDKHTGAIMEEAADATKNVLGFLEDEYPNAPMTLKFRTAIEQMEKLDPVAWELRKGKTDHVLIDITNNKTVAMNWKCSLEEVVPLYDLRGIKE